ncbi:MAG: WS/DGAT domain-containing protein [Microthrixaceae bacterium]|nr:WS/DGAT domain-containing protein [Microthrixaceae bacterium]
MFVNLPVNIADPVERLMAVHRSSPGAKEIQATLGAEMLGDLVDLVPPTVLSAATSAFVGSRISERIPPAHSVIVSNVPGPDFPLYLAGAEVVGPYPFGPLMEGSGLNISVLSHDGRLDVGLIACPDLVPHLDELLAGVLRGFDELEACFP